MSMRQCSFKRIATLMGGRPSRAKSWTSKMSSFPSSENLHPLDVGDTIAARYKVLQKLGVGTTSTVWLARDSRSYEFVALKVKATEDSTNLREEQILQDLQKEAFSSREAHWQHLPHLLGTLSLQSPDGYYRVLILELLGCSLEQFIVDRGFYWEDRHSHSTLSQLKRLVKDMASAVHLVHLTGIIHRDIQPGNFLFRSSPTSNASLKSQSRIFDKLFQKSKNSQEQRSQDYQDSQIDCRKAKGGSGIHNLVLSDFGAACHFDDANDEEEAYPIAYRPPEILLGIPITPASDMWALGCTIFNLVMGSSPFYVDNFLRGQERDDSHLQCLTEAIGFLPPKYFKRWEGKTRFYDEHHLILPKQAKDPIGIPISESISELKPQDMSDNDAAIFEDLIRSIFRFEPCERLTAKQVLSHPWLDGH